jgi:hypothetical protein
MPKVAWLAVALSALMIMVTACGALGSRGNNAGAAVSPSQPLDAAQAALAPPGPTLGAMRSGDLVSWLTSRPTQPARGLAVLDVYLVVTSGQPVTDARVVLDSDMTNMSHGPNIVAAAPLGSGHYTGNVRFSMPGPWRVIAVVERPGQDTVKLRFAFNVSF